MVRKLAQSTLLQLVRLVFDVKFFDEKCNKKQIIFLIGKKNVEMVVESSEQDLISPK